MKTSLSPIALVALLVGPGLTAWARQDTPLPAKPPAPTPPEAVGVPLLAGVPLIGSASSPRDDEQELSAEELALQQKLRALEARAAELEAALQDRLDATEAQAGPGILGELLESDEKYEALEARVTEYLLQVDPERAALREVSLRDLLQTAPARVAEIQDEEVKARIHDAMQKAKVKLDPEAAVRADEFLARAEELRALAETRRHELEQGQYRKAHSRYKLLQQQADELAGRAEAMARAGMRTQREEGTRRFIEQELADVTRVAEVRRREAESVQRLERELAKREGQRRQEEDRLRTELDSERARLAEMRAKLEEGRVQMERDTRRADRPQPVDRWIQRAAPRTESPRAESPRPASSDVTIIVEQGDVHVHTGGGTAPVITQPSPRLFFNRAVPLPAPPAPPAPPESQGTTQAPGYIRYWSVPSESLAEASVEYVRTFSGANESFSVELSPDIPFYDFEVEYTFPDVELEFFQARPKPEVQPVLEVEPECEPAPEIELEGGVVVRGDGMELRANQVRFDLAASPAERAPSQVELLGRILRLSEELKAEVGALRGELRELREVVRGAPRR